MTRLEPGWLAKALDAAAERAKDMPRWLTRELTADEIEAQRKSWVRGMTTGCEHGVLDFEECPKCLHRN